MTALRPTVLAATLVLILPGIGQAEITPIEDLRRAMPAVIEGVVTRITDEDEFVIADGTGQIRVYIGPNLIPVRVTEQVRVTGAVDDDGTREFYAAEIVTADGRTIPLPRDY